MSANETRHTSETGGQKAGNDERYDLIPVEPLRRLAIYAGTRSLRATGNMAEMCNHIWLFWSGEEVDATTEWVHLIAASWHAMRLAEQNNFTSAHPYDTSEHGRSRARYDLIPAEPLGCSPSTLGWDHVNTTTTTGAEDMTGDCLSPHSIDTCGNGGQEKRSTRRPAVRT